MHVPVYICLDRWNGEYIVDVHGHGHHAVLDNYNTYTWQSRFPRFQLYSVGGMSYLFQLCSFGLTELSGNHHSYIDEIDDEMNVNRLYENTLCLMLDMIGVYVNDCPDNITDLHDHYGLLVLSQLLSQKKTSLQRYICSQSNLKLVVSLLKLRYIYAHIYMYIHTYSYIHAHTYMLIHM